MIVRILHDGQYRIGDADVAAIQALDEHVEEAVAGSDDQAFMAALERLVDPDFVYIVRGHSSLSGEYRGWDAWAKGLARIKELTAGSMAATPEVILADDDHVMMYARFTGSRPDGRTYNSHQAYLYRLKDGRLLEGQTIPADQEAFAEFLA